MSECFFVNEADEGVFVERCFLVWCSPRGLVEAPHDSGVGWKQFMTLLEEVLVHGDAAFQTPLRVPGYDGI